MAPRPVIVSAGTLEWTIPLPVFRLSGRVTRYPGVRPGVRILPYTSVSDWTQPITLSAGDSRAFASSLAVYMGDRNELHAASHTTGHALKQLALAGWHGAENGGLRITLGDRSIWRGKPSLDSSVGVGQ